MNSKPSTPFLPQVGSVGGANDTKRWFALWWRKPESRQRLERCTKETEPTTDLRAKESPALGGHNNAIPMGPTSAHTSQTPTTSSRQALPRDLS